jgi:hypothetical protein
MNSKISSNYSIDNQGSSDILRGQEVKSHVDIRGPTQPKDQ